MNNSFLKSIILLTRKMGNVVTCTYTNGQLRIQYVETFNIMDINTDMFISENEKNNSIEKHKGSVDRKSTEGYRRWLDNIGTNGQIILTEKCEKVKS